MDAPQFDVLIRGGGPVGCTLAPALRGSGRRVALAGRRADRAAPGGFRPIALSYASRLILERLGAWRGLSPSPIERIEGSPAGRLRRPPPAAGRGRGAGARGGGGAGGGPGGRELRGARRGIIQRCKREALHAGRGGRAGARRATRGPAGIRALPPPGAPPRPAPPP